MSSSGKGLTKSVKSFPFKSFLIPLHLRSKRFLISRDIRRSCLDLAAKMVLISDQWMFAANKRNKERIVVNLYQY